MKTISEIVREHKYRIVATNKHKRYLILALEDCDTFLWVHFDLIPSRDLFELTRDPAPYNDESIHETGVVYG